MKTPELVPSIAELVDRWLRFYVEGDDTCFGAKDELETMISERPDTALAVIEELVMKVPTDKEVGVIGAGPLEYLLCDAGPRIVDSLVNDAKKNPRLKAALGNVWQFNIDADVWTKVMTVFAEE